MVATVLKLKFDVLRHQLRREWWRALLLVAGAVWSLSLIPVIFWAQEAVHGNTADARAEIMVGFAAVCMAGWVVVPLLVTGLEDTLDPGRFASLGVPAKKLMPGLTVSAALTVPALFFTAVFVIMSWGWRPLSRHWTWVDNGSTIVTAAAGGLLTVALMVLLARVVVAWSSRLLASRRSRAWTMVGVGAVGAVFVFAAWLALKDGLESAFTYEVPAVIEALGYTPVGAGMTAPLAVANNDPVGVAWRLALMAVTVFLVHRAWRATVAHTLVHPRFRGGGIHRQADTILKGARYDAGGPVATAVRTRALVYWLTDSRYLVAATGVIALPALYLVIVIPVLGLDTRWAFAAPVMLAASIGWGRHNDIAYDSSALYLDVVAGPVGRAVVWGRMQAVLVWAVPAISVAAVGVLAWSGQWDAAPGLIGACVGALGVTLGISALTSVVLPYRAPAPGANPFGAEVGSLGASLVAQLASGAAMFAMLPLVTVPFVLALTVSPLWGGLSLIAGLAIGGGAAVAGVRLAGSLYDRRSGKLLAAVT